MTYTPVELRHVKVGRSLFGYNRATVEQVIEEVAQSFEATWRERGELAEKVHTLEKQLTELRGREHLLTQTLVAAEQAASDVRERARREAEAIITEAHHESRAIGRAAHAQREALLIEARRIEAMLRAALGVIEEGTGPTPAAQPAVGAKPVELPPVLDGRPAPAKQEIGWAREDTREFEPIAVEPVAPEPIVAPSREAPAAEVETRPEPAPEPLPEPEHQAQGESEPGNESAAQPVLHSVPGRESRDFDWGE
jgi:cell division septum initiation protein DivIVA